MCFTGASQKLKKPSKFTENSGKGEGKNGSYGLMVKESVWSDKKFWKHSGDG